MSPNDTYPQHVVTAVIVAHDGAAWLPQVIESLLEQSRPVQRVVAVDTGSRDRSGAVLSGLLGQSVVFGMDRATGYGAAVARALQHRAANLSVPGAAGLPAHERAEWIWLLHDDCEPAPDALEQLLRGAAETRSAAVLGPKVMDWSDRKVIQEAGVTIDTVGRRITGIEPREVDQGQHDGDRDVLAVGSAGMLIRRDVWDQVGGFDPAMGLFREDVDFCWRVHAAGYRVRVITDAKVYHVEASARRRRPASAVRRPRQTDRRNALLTLLANLPAGPMLSSLAGNVAVSLLRTAFFLLAKRPAAGLDEIAALGSVLGHPFQLLRARALRSRGRRAAYGRLRADLPPGRSVRRIAEFVAATMSKSAQDGTAGSHHATDDPSEDDFLLVDTGLVQRFLTHPGVALFLILTVITLVAERSLLGGGPLGGGALVPAWGGVSGLWHEFLQGFHPAGIGSGSTAPPYIAIVAVLATLLGGKPWLAVDVILLGCVPLAGAFGYFAVRRVTRSALVRVWAAAAYALLPIAMGTVAAGRLGTAVVFMLLPLIALQAGRMFTQPSRRARRAAWATGLIIAIAAAFVPLTWIIAVVAGVVTAVLAGPRRPAVARNLGIVVIVPPVLLLPWSAQLAAHPAQLLLEVGVQQPGLASQGLPARSLLLLSPGGPGLPPTWVTAGLVLAGLAALLLARRRTLVMVGWAGVLVGMLAAVAVSQFMVTPASGGPAVPVWPGIALALVGAGLVLAVASVGDALPGLRGREQPADFAARGPGKAAGPGRPRGQAGRAGLPRLGPARGSAALVLALAACSAPVLAAVYWLINGAGGPVAPAAAPVVPAVVSASADAGLQLRTLVLRSDQGQVTYSLQRGQSPLLGEPDLLPVSGAQQALDKAVATLVAPNGGEADNQGQSLSQFDVGYVLLPGPIDQGLARTLDGVAGLRPVTSTAAFDLWRLVDLPARVRVVKPDGSVVALSSGQLAVSGAHAPATGGTLELAEPAGGWSATLNGAALTKVPSPAGPWAQAYRLPPGGGSLSISHSQAGHDLVVLLEVLLIAVVAGLALPGARSAADEAAEAAAAGTGAAPPGRRRAAAAGPAGLTRARGGQPVPGQPAAGQAVPGQPPPGQPVPGQQGPVWQGQGQPGQPVAGQSMPGQPVAGQPFPGQRGPGPVTGPRRAGPAAAAAAASAAGMAADAMADDEMADDAGRSAAAGRLGGSAARLGKSAARLGRRAGRTAGASAAGLRPGQLAGAVRRGRRGAGGDDPGWSDDEREASARAARPGRGAGSGWPGDEQLEPGRRGDRGQRGWAGDGPDAGGRGQPGWAGDERDAASRGGGGQRGWGDDQDAGRGGQPGWIEDERGARGQRGWGGDGPDAGRGGQPGWAEGAAPRAGRGQGGWGGDRDAGRGGQPGWIEDERGARGQRGWGGDGPDAGRGGQPGWAEDERDAASGGGRGQSGPPEDEQNTGRRGRRGRRGQSGQRDDEQAAGRRGRRQSGRSGDEQDTSPRRRRGQPDWAEDEQDARRGGHGQPGWAADQTATWAGDEHGGSQRGWPEERSAAGLPGRSATGSAPDWPGADRAGWAREQGAGSARGSQSASGAAPPWPGGDPGSGRAGGGQPQGWPDDPLQRGPAGHPGGGSRPDWPGSGEQHGWPEHGRRSGWPGDEQRGRSRGADQAASWQGGRPQPGWPGDEQRAWDSGPGHRPDGASGARQRPDWAGQSGWDGEGHDPRRPPQQPPSGSAAGWPAGYPPARPAAQPARRQAAQSPGWPGGEGGDMLDPLPPADGGGQGWHGSAAGNVPPPRWPVPDHDTGEDEW
ncbi:MAG TPA: glycosyltransferase [Streptosporangiaceae bacterium]